MQTRLGRAKDDFQVENVQVESAQANNIQADYGSRTLRLDVYCQGGNQPTKYANY
jgi:hypothetical protein